MHALEYVGALFLSRDDIRSAHTFSRVMYFSNAKMPTLAYVKMFFPKPRTLQFELCQSLFSPPMMAKEHCHTEKYP